MLNTKAMRFSFLVLGLTWLFVSQSVIGSEPYESIHHLSGNVFIDGELDDWRGHPFETLGADSSFENSLSAIFSTGWNAEGLYLSAKIFDDIVQVADEADTLDFRRMDCLELFLDVTGRSVGSFRPDGLDSKGMVVVDGFRVLGHDGTVRIVDDEDPGVRFLSGQWERRRGPYFGGSASFVTLNEAFKVEFEFEGEEVALLSPLGSWGGAVRVGVDEVYEDVSLFYEQDKNSSEVSRFSGLGNGKHRVVLRDIPVELNKVRHVLISPEGERPGQWPFDDSIAVRTPYGWNVEAMIAWSSLGRSEPSLGDWIRFGYKIYDYDADADEVPNVLGLARHGDGTTIEWLYSNPERFPRFALAKKSDIVDVEKYAKETVWGGESFIAIDFKKPIGPGEHALIVDGSVRSGGKILREFAFRVSGGGRFLCYDELIPISEFEEKESHGKSFISFDVVVRGKQDDVYGFEIEPKIRNALVEIESKLPTSFVSSLSESVRPAVLLFKQNAVELASHFSDRRNRHILHYHYLNYYESRERLWSDIRQLLSLAANWWDSAISEGGGKRSHLQAWKSKADGSWQFFLLKLPYPFDSDKAYDVEIEFHHENKREFSMQNLLLNRLAASEGGARPVYQGDGIHIQLLGRGNSFSELGDEEFTYVLNWLDEYYSPVNAVRLYGVSAGGRYAALFASRYSDRLSGLDLKSPMFKHIVAGVSSGLYDTKRYYKIFRGSVSDKFVNLRNLPVRISVGELESETRNLLNHLSSYFEDSLFDFRVDVVPEKDHFHARSNVPRLAMLPKKFGVIPSTIHCFQSSLRYGSLYGLTVVEKQFPWKPYGFIVEDFMVGRKRIITENINKLKIGGDIIKDLLGGESFLIDGQALEVVEYDEGGAMNLSRETGEWNVVDQFESGLMKRPSLEGPIGDIEKEGFIIVYGSKDEDSTPVLFNRARKIVEDRSGSDLGQWDGGAFEVKSDRQVTELDIETKNLWLIGNADENSIVNRLLPQLNVIIEPDKIVIKGVEVPGENLFLEMLGRNPMSVGNYVYIECGQVLSCYSVDVLSNREFDFAITEVDLRENKNVVSGVFDNEWSLGSGFSKVWFTR